MSRPLRLELSGGIYHVTSRGDGREDIYLSDHDREVWLAVLSQVCKRFNWGMPRLEKAGVKKAGVRSCDNTSFHAIFPVWRVH